MGGGVACPGCGKKGLDPVADPRQATVFGTSATLHFPCEGCGETYALTYSWDGPSGTVPHESAPSDQVQAVKKLARLAACDDDALIADLARLGDDPDLDLPGLRPFARRGAELRRRRLDPDRCAACAKDGLKPLLRRLKEASPLFCRACFSVSAQVEPRLRLHGQGLKALLGDLERRANDEDAAGTLRYLQEAVSELPYMPKVPPFQPYLAKALVGLRRMLAERGGRLLPVATRAGVVLVDPSSGEAAFHLPAMQAGATEVPRALGFVDRKVYYQEPGELSLTAHPLVAGSAWRTALDGPVMRIGELGKALLVETLASLTLISGASGRVRWSLGRDELDGLQAWDIVGGHLVVCGEGELRAYDPATGAQASSHKLPRKARLVRILRGDLPGPCAIVDQGYGPGIFGPEVEDFKGGVKPITRPSDDIVAPEVLWAEAREGVVLALWGSEDDRTQRGVVRGPLEKSFAGFACEAAAEVSASKALAKSADGRFVFAPGDPVTVIDVEAGERVEDAPEVDGSLAVFAFGELLLALGASGLSALKAADPSAVLWQTPLQAALAIDVPGDCLAPLAVLPGADAGEVDPETSAVGLPGLED